MFNYMFIYSAICLIEAQYTLYTHVVCVSEKRKIFVSIHVCVHAVQLYLFCSTDWSANMRAIYRWY